MEKRQIDKLGVETSLLGFGCMRFPTTQDGKIDEERATAMLDKAFEAGVNYYDTAYPYHDGDSEPFLGKYLDGRKREDYFLATKLPVWEINSVEDAAKMFEKQLERLNKDYVDFYLLHALNKERFVKMRDIGIIEFCEKLKEQGKIRFFGFSFHDEYEVFEEILNYRDWDFCQIQYNYMDIDEQAGDKGYELTVKKNVPLVIMEPIKGGMLANLPQEITDDFPNKEASAASYALRFVASRLNVKVVLSGMSDENQVADNLNTFSNFVPLSDEEEKIIAGVRDSLNRRVRNGCTGCRYCLPCPNGVGIPWNFKVWNTYNIYNDVNNLKWNYNNILNDKAEADRCVGCGLCESKCPQKINIREDLRVLSLEIKEILECK